MYGYMGGGMALGTWEVVWLWRLLEDLDPHKPTTILYDNQV